MKDTGDCRGRQGLVPTWEMVLGIEEERMTQQKRNE